MNKIAKFAMLTSALLIPHVANAAAPSGTYTGTVDVFKGVAATCGVTLDLTVAGKAKIYLTGGPVCAALQFVYPDPTGFDTSYSAGPPETFTIEDVLVETYSAGDCFGNIVAEVDGGTLYIVEAELPPVDPLTPKCTIDGAVTLVP